MRHLLQGRFQVVPVAAALVLGSSGCQRSPQDGNAAANANASAALPALPEALPLAGGAPISSATAPLAAALLGRLPAQRARLADPRGGYAYLDRAYGQSAATDVAPPDYAFSYGDVRPWGWQAADESREIVEPVAGGYRYYYYRPGADAPYLVRDPGYSYAYDGPALVAVFDREGRALPADPGYNQALYAGRYLARAQALYAASRANRSGVIAADWAAHRAEIDAARSAWAAQQARQAAWQAYHAEHAAEEQAYWAGERERRAEAAARFADWHARSFSGPPPVLYASAPPVPRVAPPTTPAPAYAPVFRSAPQAARVRPVVASLPAGPARLADPHRVASLEQPGTNRASVGAEPHRTIAPVLPGNADRIAPAAPPRPHEPASVLAARIAPTSAGRHSPAPSRTDPRAVEFRSALPPHEPHHTSPPERVTVARGADLPRAEAPRSSELPHAPPPHFAPAPPRPAAVARAEPPHAAPHPQPEHHAEPPHLQHHEPDRHGGGVHEQH